MDYQNAHPVASYAIFKPHVYPVAGSIAAFLLFLVKMPIVIAGLPPALQSSLLREIQPRLALSDVFVVGLLLMVAAEYWMGTRSGYRFSRRERIGSLVMGVLLVASLLAKMAIVL